MKCNFPSMTKSEYIKWMKNPTSKEASLPEFFSKGIKRTTNVIEGRATEASVKKRDSFLARHGAQYCKNPTARRRIAIKNWGFNVVKDPKEKQNIRG